MSKRIMAGRNTPVSRNNETDGPSVEDLIENKLEQLRSLLLFCYGDDSPMVLQRGARGKHWDNVIWLAADLVAELRELFQQFLIRERAVRG